MDLVCGGPGCSRDATATLQIDTNATMVRISDSESSIEGIALCSRHANATSAPVGWELADERSLAEPSEVEVEQDVDLTETVTSRPTKRRTTENLSGDRVSKFQFDYEFTEDECPSDLKVTSPLLARAFRSSKSKR